MVKQQVHLRKIGNKLVKAGKGTKPSLVGKLVTYKRKVYTVSRKNTNGTYDIVNLTERLRASNVKRSQLGKY